ncbi:hypothetical protein C2E23DRAFT_860094 [Lenzites betulinus]|nr:hypothetical protein C2E23DRAFT_860094 [Lenzites betulinus]
MNSSSSPQRSPHSSPVPGSALRHSDFLGAATQEEQLHDSLSGLDIFSDPSDLPYPDEPASVSQPASDMALFSNFVDFTPWSSSPGYHNSLHLAGTTATDGSPTDPFARPFLPLHDSYYGPTDSAYGSHSSRPVPRIHVETEHLPPFSAASLDPRSPAFERSPTALMTPTPTHPSPSSIGSYPPVTPQSPFSASPFGTPYIHQASNSPISPPHHTIQPLALGHLASSSALYSAILETLCTPPQSVANVGPQKVLHLAQFYGHPFGGELVPQQDYRPHTQSDRRRYVDQVDLDAPIFFFTQNPAALGIPLKDAITSRFMQLVDRDDPMLKDRGPSVSIRLNWPGYAPWSRQIPTRDFRSPPHPVTRAKLARNVAKTIKRFIDEMDGRRMEDESQSKWRVGRRHIKLEELMLVGLQHVSMGSWQAHLRLVRRR